jgi:hypothetical protein
MCVLDVGAVDRLGHGAAWPGVGVAVQLVTKAASVAAYLSNASGAVCGGGEAVGYVVLTGSDLQQPPSRPPAEGGPRGASPT